MKFKLFFFITIVSCSNFFGQSNFKWNSKNDKIEIDFQYISNLIIIPIELNDVKLNMVLDTGAESSFIFSLPVNDSIQFQDTRKIKIKGFGNSESVDALISEKNKVNIANYVNNNFTLLIVLNQNINISERLGTPVNGILNYSFFKNHLVGIDYLTKKITIYKNSKKILKKSKFKKFSKLPVTTINNRPYIDVDAQINDKDFSLKLLIDIGLGGGLWLFENPELKCDDVFFEDVLGLGLNGEIIGKKSRITKLKLAEYVLNDALVSYPYKAYLPKTGIIEGRNGSIGGEIFKRFTIFFNFPEDEIYLKKNSNFSKPFNYNMSGIEVEHNGLEYVRETIKLPTSLAYGVKDEHIVFRDSDFKYKFELQPIFQISSVRENSPASKTGIKAGDKIIKINKKEVHNYSIDKISELLQSEEGKWIYIDIERNGTPIAFKFQLKKII